MKRYLLALAVGAALTVAPFAGPSDSQKAITVGDFAVKVSRALGLAAPDRTVAVQSLRSVGVDLGSSLDARVTEGMAAEALGSLGLRISTSNPDGAISAAKAEALTTRLALTSLRGLSTESLPAPPTQCLQLRQGRCIQCCKQALGNASGGSNVDGFGVDGSSSDGGGKVNKLCKRFCKTGEFPSPSAPGR